MDSNHLVEESLDSGPRTGNFRGRLRRNDEQEPRPLCGHPPPVMDSNHLVGESLDSGLRDCVIIELRLTGSRPDIFQKFTKNKNRLPSLLWVSPPF